MFCKDPDQHELALPFCPITAFGDHLCWKSSAAQWLGHPLGAEFHCSVICGSVSTVLSPSKLSRSEKDAIHNCTKLKDTGWHCHGPTIHTYKTNLHYRYNDDHLVLSTFQNSVFWQSSHTWTSGNPIPLPQIYLNPR